MINNYICAGDLENVKISAPCIVTGKDYSVTVPLPAWHSYTVKGALAQDAFPMLSTDDREFLISGTSPEGWNELFGSDEDDLSHFQPDE